MHTCVVWRDGTVMCFGCRGCVHNQTHVPPIIQGRTKSITCGVRHTCVLLLPVPPAVSANVSQGGDVVCWGDNGEGQASPPTSLKAVHLSAGALHTCAVGLNQSLVCWGNNLYLQSTPPSGGGYVGVSAGLTFTCALRSTIGTDIFGRIECFGHFFSSSTTFTPPAAATTTTTTTTSDSSADPPSKGVAEVTPGTLASQPEVPLTLAKRDFYSISVGYSHVCVTDAVDMRLHCYHVSAFDGASDAEARGTHASQVPECVNPCGLCIAPEPSGAAPTVRVCFQGKSHVMTASFVVFLHLFVLAY